MSIKNGRAPLTCAASLRVRVRPPSAGPTHLPRQQSAVCPKEMRIIKVKSYRHKQQFSSPQLLHPRYLPSLSHHPYQSPCCRRRSKCRLTDLNRRSCGCCCCFVELFVFVRSNRLVRTPRESCDLASSLCLLPCMRLFSAPRPLHAGVWVRTDVFGN